MFAKTARGASRLVGSKNGAVAILAATAVLGMAAAAAGSTAPDNARRDTVPDGYQSTVVAEFLSPLPDSDALPVIVTVARTDEAAFDVPDVRAIASAVTEIVATHDASHTAVVPGLDLASLPAPTETAADTATPAVTPAEPVADEPATDDETVGIDTAAVDAGPTAAGPDPVPTPLTPEEHERDAFGMGPSMLEKERTILDGAITLAAGTRAAYFTVALPIAGNSSDLLDALRADVTARFDTRFTTTVSGPGVVHTEQNDWIDAAGRNVGAAGLAVMALIILAAFRRPLLVVGPVLVTGAGIAISTASAGFLARLTDIPVDGTGRLVVAVVAFAAGVHASVTFITRFRDELRRDADIIGAVQHTVVFAGREVAAAMMTVAAMFSALLVSSIPSVRGLGAAGAITALISLAGSLVTLPAALLVGGRRQFHPKSPAVGEELSTDREGIWKRIGLLLEVRAGIVIGLTVALLGLAGYASVTNTPTYVGAETFRNTTDLPAAQGFLRNPVPLVTILTPVESVDDVVNTLGSFPGRDGDPSVGVFQRVAVITMHGTVDVAENAGQAVDEIRASLAKYPSTNVGGVYAERLDHDRAAEREQSLLVGFVLLITAGALMLLFRALVAALVLTVSLVFIYLASIQGASALTNLVFADRALDSLVPVLSLLLVVTLGFHATVSMLALTREEAVEHGTIDAGIRALSSVGGPLLTSGALISAAVAAAAVLTDHVLLSQTAAAVAIGVAIDAVLIRSLFIPAMAERLDELIWWPDL